MTFPNPAVADEARALAESHYSTDQLRHLRNTYNTALVLRQCKGIGPARAPKADAWKLRRADGTEEEPTVDVDAVYERSQQFPYETITVLRRINGAWEIDQEMWGEEPPGPWVLVIDGGRGDDEHSFPSEEEALASLAIHVRECWYQLTDLNAPGLPAGPPVDDAVAIGTYFWATGETYELKRVDDYKRTGA
ncbi:hypothetical protein [Microtetraspora malaysiensis]|uniref:Uncharacterized protein n=1 Tax=Microtetraspora malaysiensis TaxID=161358 RepID=A0ABW6SKD6_9ACTN